MPERVQTDLFEACQGADPSKHMRHTDNATFEGFGREYPLAVFKFWLLDKLIDRSRAEGADLGSRLAVSEMDALMGNVQPCPGEVEDLLATHRVLTGPAAQADQCGSQFSVVQVKRAATQAHLLVRTATADAPVPPGWEAHPVSLQELTLAYLRQPGGTAAPGPASSKHAEATEVA